MPTLQQSANRGTLQASRLRESIKFNSMSKTNKYFNHYTTTNTKSHSSHHPLSPARAAVESRTRTKLTQP